MRFRSYQQHFTYLAKPMFKGNYVHQQRWIVERGRQAGVLMKNPSAMLVWMEAAPKYVTISVVQHVKLILWCTVLKS